MCVHVRSINPTLIVMYLSIKNVTAWPSQKNKFTIRKRIFHHRELLTYLVRRSQKKTLFVLFLLLHPGFHLPSSIPQLHRLTFVKFFPARFASCAQLWDLWRGWYSDRIPTYQTEIKHKQCVNFLLQSNFKFILVCFRPLTLNRLDIFRKTF